MTQDKTKTAEGAALWRRFSEGRGPAETVETPDAMTLAAYLDGTLDETQAARVEAQLAADPALLDEVLELHRSLGTTPAGAPASVIARAQALRPEQKDSLRPEQKDSLRPVLSAASSAAEAQPGWLGRRLGAWLRPAVPAFATLAIAIACAGAFELGRYQAEQLEAEEIAGQAESDVPVDVLLEGLL